MGWVLAASCINTILCYIFFILYSILLWPVTATLNLIKLDKLAQLIQLNSTKIRAVLFLNLLSLGGLPPFTGFLPKWIILRRTHRPAILLIIISISLVTLLFYLRITLRGFILTTANEIINMTNKLPWHIIFTTQVSLSILFLSSLI